MEWPTKFVSKLYLLIKENLLNDTVADCLALDGDGGSTGST